MGKRDRETKSDRTRGAILAAARDLFAAQGYERTTVRDIAGLASIDPSMVIRYFVGKDELFARVATIDLKLPDIESIVPSRLGEALVRHFLHLWEEDGRSGLPVLLRSAASNEFAATKLREVFARQVIPALERGRARTDVAERAGLVASQLIGLAMCRYVLKLPAVVGMSRDLIINEVGWTIQRYVSD